jgi:hypothetical protein
MTPDTRTQARKDRLAETRGRKTVDTFRVAHKGFRRIFGKHFGSDHAAVEAVAFHLARIEASLPTVREAIRLARYPNAGNRNPKRFALGLSENLSALQAQLEHANRALEALASGRPYEAHGEEE